MSNLRDDILSKDLTQEQVKVIVKTQFDSIIESSIGSKSGQVPRSRTPGASKDVYEFCDLVRQAIDHKQDLLQVTDEAKILFTQEMSDVDQRLEAITFSLEKRIPGQFSEGKPFSGDVRNMVPMIREVFEDPENPGYRKVVLGYWFDNLVNFTCWARTNKEANKRSMWFEQLMSDYTWLYRIQGVSRVLFWDHGPDVERVVDTTSTTQSTTNKFYGRPMLYYVRTERISTTSEKELEQLIIKLTTSDK